MDKFIEENDFNWLMLPVPDVDNDRPWMELIHVTNGSAYTTDGRRMHVAPCKLGDGSYRPHELRESLDFERESPSPLEDRAFDVNQLRLAMVRQAGKAFNPDSEVTASDFYVQNGFYGQLVPKDGSSKFQRIYVLEATFGMSTKGQTILHTYTADDGENFMYANDGERSFVVMGMRLDKESDCE